MYVIDFIIRLLFLICSVTHTVQGVRIKFVSKLVNNNHYNSIIKIL